MRQTVPYGRELPAAATAGASGRVVPAALGSAATLADAPAAESFGQDALLYRIGESPCAVLRAGLDGIAAGPCGEPLQPRVYVRPDRAVRLADLVARYAPFELEVGDEEVELHGRGTQEAGPVERRLVLEWARRLLAEARGVTATRGFRLAFEWHRQLQGGRDCDALAIYLSGEALATTCDGLHTTGDVAPERMAAILDWHDRLAPFQVVRERGVGAEEVSQRLILPGAGTEEQDDETVRTIVALADALHADLLARQLARQQEEEARLAALEAARLAERQAAQQAAAAQRPWMPPPPEGEDQAEMTLSESIGVGAGEGERVTLGPEEEEGEEDEEGSGDEDDGDAGAAQGTIEIRPSPPPVEPEDDGDGDPGDDGEP